jgi:hypothetical protein
MSQTGQTKFNNYDKEERDSKPMSNFLFALKSPESKRQYPRRLKMFFEFEFDKTLSLEAQASLFLKQASKGKNGIQWATQYFIRFLNYQKDRAQKGEISESTIPNYYKAAKLFCVMNDLIVNWQKIGKGVPYEKKAADDRPPSLEEILKLLEYPDTRIKPIILTMISSGIRLGAFDFLRWKHIKPIKDDNGKIIAASLLVYATDEEQYLTFITPEAYLALETWMNYRKVHGEKVNSESWVIRDIWQTSERSYGAYFGLAKNPKQLNSKGIKSLIERAIHAQGLWKPLEGKKRREWKGAHGFRKYFKTQAEQIMKSINVEILMGHNIGVSKCYYKPTEKEILEDYVKAVKLLSVDKSSNNELESKVKELTEKQDEITLMKIKHEREMRAMDQRLDKIISVIQENPKLAKIKTEVIKGKVK